MGYVKRFRCAVFLALTIFQAPIITGQGVLQVEPEPSFSDFHRQNGGKKDVSTVQHQAASSEDASTMDDQTLPWRLPRDVIPTEYSVRIAPNIDIGQEDIIGEQWFTPGDMNITVQAQSATLNIVLHSKNITIHSLHVRQGTFDIPVLSYVPGQYDFLNITLGASLERGHTYTIAINFTSYITTDLNGLYRSSYINPDTGDRIWLATTQFEALHARQMMPCFDEPALKSIFHFTIGHMEKYLALFNTESTGKSAGPTGWVWETFAPTVKQSTYLLALIVSEFTYAESQGNLLPTKKVRTYAPDHYIRDGAGIYAADHAEEIIAYFGKYFNQEYPLSKMDSAAVPDFFFGAMENYGLNIYRESALLVFPNISLESERWSITSVIAHELAHQWFGDLVSPAFWTHIWLNEGFATYFASVGASYTHPEFEAGKRFLNDAVQRSMESAADPNVAHSVKIGESEWINKYSMDWFDRMAYEQAGSLIRMMDGFLTTPVFTGGLKFYLNQYKFNSAQQDFLFQELNTAAELAGKLPNNLTIKDIMDTWTLKAGFPLVRVSRASSNRVYISQEKFVNNAGALTAGSFVEDELWHIPISVASKSSPNFDPQPEMWLDKNVAMTSWEINTDEWILLNAGVTGYYRVLYDVQMTNLIKAQLESNHNAIDALSRSQLQDDYFTSAYQKYINLATALDLTVYLSSETEIIVWNAVLKHLRKPLNLIGSSSGSGFSDLRGYLLPRIKSALNATGGVKATFAERAGMPILRHQQFLDWACALEDEECRQFAVDSVNNWKTNANDNPIPRDIHTIVYCAAVAKGGDDIFQFIKQRYNDSTTTSIQRSRLLNALGCSTDSASLQELLEGVITEGYFKTVNDAGSILTKLASSPTARARVVEFVKSNASDIKTRLGSAPIASVFTTAASYVSTPAELETLRTIASDIAYVIDDADQKARIDGALVTIQSNVLWMNDFGTAFISFFQSKV